MKFSNNSKWSSPAIHRTFRTLSVSALLLCFVTAGSNAQNYKILHTFGTNLSGIFPHGTLVRGPDGAFYGSTEKGGVANCGQVFKMNPNGSEYAVLKDFGGQDGSGPQAALLLIGTSLYGTTAYGGSSSNGTVFRLNTDGSGFAVLKQFAGDDGARPFASLVLSGTTLYGTTYLGGISNLGTIFKLGTDGTDFAVLRSFTGNDGSNPLAGLCLSPGGVLYGTTRNGGGNGNVFSVNLDGSGFNVLKAFDNTVWFPNGVLALSGATLYGTTVFGTNSSVGIGGTVFKLNVDGSGFAVLKDFAQSEGSWPDADLVLAGNTLYGSTYSGGASNCGAVFKLNTDGTMFTVIKSFTPAERAPGNYPLEVQWKAGLSLSGTTLSGTIPQGGLAGLGSLFQIKTDGSEFVVLKEFTGGDGQQPYSGLAQGLDGTLYGTTYLGGTAARGTIFSLNSDGSGYSNLKSFIGSDGSEPEAGLLVSGTTLFGTTTYGGSSNYGTVFSMNTDGSGFAQLWNCASYDSGVFPTTIPVLSGTTLFGGINYGKIFRMNTDGTGYSYLSVDPTGGMPQDLLLDGTTLYGTEMEGGPSYYDGMVYKINRDGSGFTILKVMGGSDGRWPKGPLVLFGNTLYGTAFAGGAYNGGTLFKLNTDGNGFGVLRQFTGGSDGSGPSSGLLLSGNVLFGTCSGSQNGVNQGTVFKINTDGTGFELLKTFHGYDGSYPLGNLVIAGTNMYGTTLRGGALDQGVIFKLSVPAVLPVILTSPSTQTAEAGTTVTFRVRAQGALPLTYEWFSDGTILGVSTNCSLTLPRIQPSQAGTYAVIVINNYGAATSAPAMLSVIAPVERRSVPGMNLTADVGAVLNLESTSAMEPAATWLHLDTVTLSTSPQWWFDLTDPIPPQRFYRAWQTAPVNVTPTLGLKIVPALTLTGTIGSQLRVDCINIVGPTDAWVTLDTVTLASSPQLYFDVSAPSQPPRLWRIVPVP
jgi:uncharacterized repeat protein (TIGR03803 family)